MVKLSARSLSDMAVLFRVILLTWWIFAYHTEIKGVSFKNCYQNVRNPQTIYCQRQNIHNLNGISDLPSDTKVLNLSVNRLTLLSKHSFFNLADLEELRLDNNQITEIQDFAFQGLESLKILNLSSNNLTTFPRSARETLAMLTVLILSNNSLSTLCSQGFLQLFNLQTLDVSFNQLDCGNMSCQSNFSSLEKLVAQGIGNKCLYFPFTQKPYLNYLDFSNNNLNALPSVSHRIINVTHVDLSGNLLSRPQALAPLNPRSIDLRNNPMNIALLLTNTSWAPRLQSVSLSLQPSLSHHASLCALCDVLTMRQVSSLHLTKGQYSEPKGAFQNCSSLRYLDLSQNEIQKPQLFSCHQHLSALQTLKLDHNHIRNLNFCTNFKQYPSFPNLKFLNLQHNHIFFIPDKAFSDMPRLSQLNLAENNIGFINSSAFFGLKNLKELILFRNAIEVVYDVAFRDLGKLNVLKLRNNRLRSLYKNSFGSLSRLQVLDLGGNNLQYISAGAFEGLPELTYLYLDRNQLKMVMRWIFINLKKLQILDLVSNNLRFHEGTPPPFHELSSLHTLKIQRQQPHGIRQLPAKLFSGLWNLTQLYLSSNKLYGLESMPFSVLGKLTHLEMSDMCNGEAHIPNGTFTSLSSLTTLVLENFGLTEIGAQSFNIPTLLDLVLTNNMIQTIPSNIEQFLPQLRFLDIRFNPLACTCANEEFRLWAITSRVHVILFYKIRCPFSVTETPKKLADGQPAICTEPVEFLAFMLSATMSMLVLSAGLAYGKGRWYFLYGYYMLRIWFKEIQLRKNRSKYRYDAFVSYSSQDEEWVLQNLVPSLEAGHDGRGGRPCTLCLHHRDFQPGRAIVSNIVEAVYTSRKTLCVVSPHYFSSEWCSMEVQVALYRLFDEHNDLLVLIFLEAPPTWALSTFHRLRRVVRQRTYLQWPEDPSEQSVFWARLRLSLQLPEGDEDPEDGGRL